MPFKRSSCRLVLAATLALAAAAVSGPVQAGKADDTLVYASDNEVDKVSPYHSSLREGVILARHVWDTLVWRDPVSGEYRPQLATGWKWLSPTALVIDLRKDVVFHNGDRFSADDVVHTFSQVLAPEFKAVNRAQVEWVKSVEKLGEHQVRLNLKAPFPAALDYLSGPMPIYPAAYLRKVGLDGFLKAPVGTGPYKVVSVVPGQGVTLQKNTAYFKGGPQGQPRIGTLKFVVLPDQETRIAQLMTGGVDWIWRVPADQADALRRAPGITVQSGETMRVGYLTMDSRGSSAADTPFKDARVRQAVNLALNRTALARTLVRGGAQPAWSPCFRSQVGCETQKVVRYPHDPAQAKALLAAAGYPDGFDTELHAYRDREYAEAVIGDLRKIGIRARLRFVKATALQNDYRAGKLPLTFQAWGSLSVNDASAFVSVWFKGTADDQTRDPELKAWLEEADTAADPTARKALYAKALEKIAREAYWAPMFSYSTNYAYTASLNFRSYADELPRFYEASWK